VILQNKLRTNNYFRPTVQAMTMRLHPLAGQTLIPSGFLLCAPLARRPLGSAQYAGASMDDRAPLDAIGWLTGS
jgi:hypothetical protein